MLSVYRKEMRAYFVSPIPYVVMVLFTVLVAGWFFIVQDFFLRGVASLDSFFGFLPWVFIIIVPAISMRLWSEEARGGTLEMLMTMPARTSAVVWGKFLSAWSLLGLALFATFPIPLTVALLGELDPGPVVCGYLGALLLGGALLSLGLWISSLTNHQIVAFLITAVAIFVLVLMGFLSGQAGGAVGVAFERLSVSTRYESMGRGVLDLRDLIYFASFACLFLYLNAVAVENRRFK